MTACYPDKELREFFEADCSGVGWSHGRHGTSVFDCASVNKTMAALSPDVVEKLKALCPVGAAVDYSAAIAEHLPNPASLGSLSDYVSCAGEERAEEISLFRREVNGFTRRAAPGPTDWPLP